MAEVYFSLGSNVGNRRKFLADALKLLEEHIRLKAVSSIYRTRPWGKKNQPDFLNLCIFGETALTPVELLSFVKSVESGLGRIHVERWGPREIDIDILFYANEVLKSPGLEIPHPHLHDRAFVLIPLAEIAPGIKHPSTGKTIAELARNIDSSGVSKVSE